MEMKDELQVSIILLYCNNAFIKSAVLNTYKRCRYIEVHPGPYHKRCFHAHDKFIQIPKKGLSINLCDFTCFSTLCILNVWGDKIYATGA